MKHSSILLKINTMDYTLKIVPEKNGCRYLLCDQNENYYVLNRTTYELLQSYLEHKDFTAVAAQMKYMHPEIGTTPCSVQKCVESVTTALSNNKRNKYVRPIATIVKPNRGEDIYKPLSLFFHSRAFLFLFAISLFTTIAFLLVKAKYYSFSGASIKQLPVYYILFLFLLFIHELGHAAAAYAYGIKPKEIAFGIYFIFPVLYTNVSGIWGSSIHIKEQ